MINVMDNYTSTGKKFWCWPEQMKAYYQDLPGTVISTHISPEGYCNLNCPYCSVSKRTQHGRIPFDTIKTYVLKLKQYGLKAVILTGGGEPLLYPEIDELMMWLKHNKMKIGLITNGTMSKCLTDYSWGKLAWVRVSLSVFGGRKNEVSLPLEALAKDCVVGCSFVYTGERKATFGPVSQIADRLGADYIRLLPNCLLPRLELELMHRKLARLIVQLQTRDRRYFHQWKQHRAPNTAICHQSHFRPYLSEEPYWENDLCGSVYPCDSVVLNDAVRKFKKKFQLCYASDVDKFLKGEMKPKFDPRKDCKGCVFTDTVEMLGQWKQSGIAEESDERLNHKEFV